MSRNTDLGWAWKQFGPTWKAKGIKERPAGMSRKEWKKKRREKPKRDLLHAQGDDFYLSKPWLKMRIKCFAVYGRKCMSCDRLDGEMHIDHIKPRSKFPELSLTFDNLQVLCRDCNMAKWNYHATDYREDSAGRNLDLETVAALRSWL